MEFRAYTYTTRSGAAATTAVVASVADGPAAKADGLMTCVTLPRIARSGNGDVEALVARRMC